MVTFPIDLTPLYNKYKENSISFAGTIREKDGTLFLEFLDGVFAKDGDIVHVVETDTLLNRRLHNPRTNLRFWLTHDEYLLCSKKRLLAATEDEPESQTQNGLTI